MEHTDISFDASYRLGFDELYRQWRAEQKRPGEIAYIVPTMSGPDAHNVVVFYGVPKVFLPVLKTSGAAFLSQKGELSFRADPFSQGIGRLIGRIPCAHFSITDIAIGAASVTDGRMGIADRIKRSTIWATKGSPWADVMSFGHNGIMRFGRKVCQRHQGSRNGD